MTERPDGNPLYWPFIENRPALCATNHTTAADQEPEFEAALESIVLLKNSGVLPLDKGDSVDLYGTMAEVFQYGCYSSIIRDTVTDAEGKNVTRFSDNADSYDNAEHGWEAAISARQALEKTVDTTSRTYEAMEIVTIQNDAGKYLTTDEEGNLSFTRSEDDTPVLSGTGARIVQLAPWPPDSGPTVSSASPPTGPPH
jgi:beta-glucosidase-like glycosyl hydrolase